MTIDLKYLIPFVLPFIILAMLRALCFVAVAEWSDPGFAVVSSVFIGTLSGVICVGIMVEAGIEWNVRIGGKK